MLLRRSKVPSDIQLTPHGLWCWGGLILRFSLLSAFLKIDLQVTICSRKSWQFLLTYQDLVMYKFLRSVKLWVVHTTYSFRSKNVDTVTEYLHSTQHLPVILRHWLLLTTASSYSEDRKNTIEGFTVSSIHHHPLICYGPCFISLTQIMSCYRTISAKRVFS